MNTPYADTSPSQTACLAIARALKFNGNVAIQSCGVAKISGEHLLVKDNMLLVVLEGRLRIRYGKAAYAVESGHMALLRKDILVKYSTSSQSGYHDNTNFIMIYFEDVILKEFVKLTHLTLLPPKQLSSVTMASVGTRLLKVINSLDTYFSEPESTDEYLIKIKLLELLFNLAQAESAVLPQLLDLRPHFRPDITSTIEDHVMTPMSLTQLAALSGRSLSSFKRDFFAIYNMPPSTWVRLRRLDKARELLLNTTMTVTDVCYTLGFENLAHFSRLFKSYFGYPPSKARRTTLKVA